MDFRLSPEAEELRSELRAFLDEFLTEELEEHLYRSGVSHHEGFVRGLISRGWFAPSWAEAEGGPGLDPTSTMVITEELGAHDAPTYGTSVSLMVAKTLHHFGTEEMRRDVIPGVLRGETICVLGFSEPEAGSDVANAQTRAVRDGDEWVINGSKMFTTNAQIGDYVYLLTAPTRGWRSTGGSPPSSYRWTSRASRSRRCTRCPVNGRTSPSTTTCGCPIRPASAMSTGAGGS